QPRGHQGARRRCAASTHWQLDRRRQSLEVDALELQVALQLTEWVRAVCRGEFQEGSQVLFDQPGAVDRGDLGRGPLSTGASRVAIKARAVAAPRPRIGSSIGAGSRWKWTPSNCR